MTAAAECVAVSWQDGSSRSDWGVSAATHAAFSYPRMADGIQHAGDTSKIWEEGSGVFLPTIRSVPATSPNIPEAF
jgi:hypothetical protein